MAELEGLIKCDVEKEEMPNYGSLSQSPANTNTSSSKSWRRGWRRSSSNRLSSASSGNVQSINVADEDISTTNLSSSSGGREHFNRSSILVDARTPICPRLPSCKVACFERFPRRRELFLVLVMLVIERYILYGAIDEVLDFIPELDADHDSTGLRAFLRVFLFYSVSRLFYPVGGFIADVYLGRCKVIHISLWFYWFAFGLLAISHVLKAMDHSIGHAAVLHTRVLPILAYLLMLLASGGFEPTLIPFGADQLEAAGSNEISAYFYWYYFTIQIGGLLNIFFNSLLCMWLPKERADMLQVLAAVAVTTLGLILHRTLEYWYFKSIVRENCIKLVAKVLWFAATVKRRLPRYRRAFRWGEGKISRINLAKQRYDGKYPNEKVEDVKTFCLLVLVIVSLCGFFSSLTGGTVMMTFRINGTVFTAVQNTSSSPSSTSFLLQLSPSMFFVVNNGFGLLLAPLVNHIIVPCLPCISMRGRMGIGMVFNILGIIIAGGIETLIHEKYILHSVHQLLLFIIPSVLITVPEVLTYTTGLEFIYAQAPESMKGMLIGLFYLVFGISSGGSTLLFFMFLSSSYVEINYAYYYWMILGLAVFGLVIYTIVACLYVNRRRPTSETEEGDDTRLLYNNITIH